MKSAKTIPFLTATLCALLSSCGVEPIPYDGPLDPVAILEFSASPKEIRAGESASLSWSTKDALFVQVTDDTDAVIGDEDLGVSLGTLEVSPRRTTRYTLTAFGASGAQRIAQVRIAVDDRGPSATLSAEHERIDLGAATRLEWKAPGAISARLLAGDEVLLEDAGSEGSLEVSPEHTTTYVLEASGAAGSTSSAEAKVEVAPVIKSFRATPSGPQLEGKTVHLLWETNGADGVHLKGKDVEYTAPAERIASGAWQVEAGAGTIVLVASRDGVEATRTLSVDILVAPTIETFEVPGEVTADDDHPATVEISWKVTGAEEIVLRQGDEVPVFLEAEGTRAFTVTSTTTFALRAINPAGEAAREAVVTAIPPATIEVELSADAVEKDEPFRISWSTTRAIFIELLKVKDGAAIPVAELDPSGEMELRVKETTVFRLVAKNEAGAPTVVERTVVVTPAAP